MTRHALVEAYHFAGAPTFHLGKFQAARDWHQQSMEVGDYRGRFHSEVYGINMGVFCRAYIGHCDWHLGYPDRALQTAEEALAIAREVAHPFSIAIALDYLAMLHQFRREPEAALGALRRRAASAGNIGSTITARGARSCGHGPSQSKARPKKGLRPMMRRWTNSKRPAPDCECRTIFACLPPFIEKPDDVPLGSGCSRGGSDR